MILSVDLSEVINNGQEDAIKVIAEELKTLSKEIFGAILVKNNGQVISIAVCSIGTIDSAGFPERYD